MAPLTGHGHHVGLRRAGSPQHQQFFLAADMTIQHGRHGRSGAPGPGGRVDAGARVGAGARLRLVKNADGAVLTDAIRHLERVDPQRELAGQQQVELLRAQADALTCPAHQWVHLVVNADAAVAWALTRPVGKPVVLVLLCREINEKRGGKNIHIRYPFVRSVYICLTAHWELLHFNMKQRQNRAMKNSTVSKE